MKKLEIVFIAIFLGICLVLWAVCSRAFPEDYAYKSVQESYPNLYKMGLRGDMTIHEGLSLLEEKVNEKKS